MNRTLALLAVAALVLAAACSGGSGDSPDPTAPAPVPSATPAASPACAPARAHPAGSSIETLQSGGLERRYILHVPSGYDGIIPAPLVFAFHGLAQYADSLDGITHLALATDDAGYVLVTPFGTGDPPWWNAYGLAQGADDPAFVDDLLSSLEATLCVDSGRVYAAGYSNGGGMALDAACVRPERFAAVAVVAAFYPNCSAAVPLLAFHGTGDPIVRYDGGETPPELGSLTYPPVRRSVSEWATELGCGGLARISKPSPEIEVSTFPGCRGGDGEVLLYSIIGGGHTWPGGFALPAEIVGKTTTEADATKLMLDFFAAHRREAAP